MPSAQKTNVDLLQGKSVVLFPWAAGFLSRDILWRVWQIVERDEDTKHLLYGSFQNPRPKDAPLDPRGGLEDFLRTMAKPENLILIPFAGEEIVGLAWFSDIVPGLRANGNIWVRKGYRQAFGLEIGWLALRYGFMMLELQDIWATTPWAHATLYARKLGFEPVVELPGYQRVDGEIHPMRILRLSRARFANG